MPPDTIQIGLRISADLLARIDAARGETSREAWLRQAAGAWLARELIALALPYRMLRNQPLQEVAELIAAQQGRPIDPNDVGDVYETVLGYLDTALDSGTHPTTERLLMRRDRMYLEGVATAFVTNDPAGGPYDFTPEHYLTSPLRWFDDWVVPGLSPPFRALEPPEDRKDTP